MEFSSIHTKKVLDHVVHCVLLDWGVQGSKSHCPIEQTSLGVDFLSEFVGRADAHDSDFLLGDAFLLISIVVRKQSWWNSHVVARDVNVIIDHSWLEVVWGVGAGPGHVVEAEVVVKFLLCVIYLILLGEEAWRSVVQVPGSDQHVLSDHLLNGLTFWDKVWSS